ncbi:MAG: hypothetical protein KDB14_07510 [Planctomycetales bacterium]|nr:hypothetical protein [Planctomycetales bacterium]
MSRKGDTAAMRTSDPDAPFLIVLGIAQDGGYPQAGCRRECCRRAWDDPTRRRHAVCLALVDPRSRQRWLLECTPDFREQLRMLDAVASAHDGGDLDGVLLTHAHIGHYTGLIHLGREVWGTCRTPVHAMPRMKHFLETNGPWSQLVSAENIVIRELIDGVPQHLNERIRATPFLVPHRDEYSETVGFLIEGPARSAFFLPDIDKWSRWETRIEVVLSRVDVAYLDGTFYADGELPGQDMSKIPHPFIEESLRCLAGQPQHERSKVRFLHFNHTNPVLDPRSPEAEQVRAAGCHLAAEGERFEL